MMKKQRTTQTAFDKVVFYGSIVGLCFLILTSAFRYFYLVPNQANVIRHNQVVEQLEEEIRLLKIENRRLKNEK